VRGFASPGFEVWASAEDRLYPVTLNLKGRRCLVVGGGAVALRKVLGLLEEGAVVTVVAPQVVADIEEQAQAGRLALEKREYRAGDTAGHALVMAATDRREVNRQVFDEAEAAGIWVNVADDPELCSFHLPARLRRGPLEIAIGSGGRAPFATRRVRQLLEKRLGPEWEPWADTAAHFREEVRRRGLPVTEREQAFELFFGKTVDPQGLRVRVPSAEEQGAWIETAGGGRIERPTPEKAAAPGSDGPGGFVSLVGAGPGCAGLLTLRGRRRLLAAHDVVYDRLAVPALPCDLPAEAKLHPVGKEAGQHPMPQDEINALLVRLGQEGRRVVRLKGGDPAVFGRGGEEAEALAAAGIPFEIVPGVTSGVAVPAWIGVPVTHRGEAVRLTLVTAHESIKRDGPQVRWDLMAQDPHATIVGYMGVTALANVVAELLRSGMSPETPAAMVQHGSTAAQRSVVSTLAELPGAVDEAGLGPPGLFVIGPSVEHAQRLDWVSRQPLGRERLVVPGSAPDLAEALEAAGADVVAVPRPITPAARIVMTALPLTGCVMRTRADVEALEEERDRLEWRDGAAVWCLGAETAQRAEARRWPGVQEVEAGSSGPDLVERIRARTSVS
jgi:uroporphyrin-III C-methyltransferase/precorrin-2 dehydrogenase/sirohydrochlorin ferrochelatase